MPSNYVYIMSNKNLTTLYIGVTNNLQKRVLEHKQGEGSEFTKKYNLKKLLYLEEAESINDAIAREKQLKRWHSEWKWNLIKSTNPELNDLADGWFDEEMIEKIDPETSSG